MKTHIETSHFLYIAWKHYFEIHGTLKEITLPRLFTDNRKNRLAYQITRNDEWKLGVRCINRNEIIKIIFYIYK